MDRMHMARAPWTGLVALLALAGCSSGRTDTPAPAPETGRAGTAAPTARVMEVPAMEAFDRALAKGTRARSGAPGPRYWQQWADYRLEAELNPVSKRLTGTAAISYYNRSPDTLAVVYVQLLHNIFAPDARHNTDVPWAVEGYRARPRLRPRARPSRTASGEGPGYQVDGTIMRIRLPKPLPPGGTADLDFDWTAPDPARRRASRWPGRRGLLHQLLVSRRWRSTTT